MKILLVGLDYHEYTNAIADEFRALGHSVQMYDIVRRNLFMKSLRVLSPKLQKRMTDRHHERIIEEERGVAYDWVLFIQCHWVSDHNMKAFREAFPTARFTLYNWDSINTHDYRPHLHVFDDAYTFDPTDALTIGIRYLPLFALRSFQDISPAPDTPSIYFVGNVVNPMRYVAVTEFRTYCETHGIAFDTFMAIRPPVLAKLLRMKLVPRGLSVVSIKPSRFRKMLELSKATYDFANHAQSGYTMRVIENLCAGKKIITNNRNILNEAFYSPDRFHLYEGNDFSGVREFLDIPLAEPAATFSEYHIQTFAKHLLEGTSHPLRVAAASDPA